MSDDISMGEPLSQWEAWALCHALIIGLSATAALRIPVSEGNKGLVACCCLFCYINEVVTFLERRICHSFLVYNRNQNLLVQNHTPPYIWECSNKLCRENSILE